MSNRLRERKESGGSLGDQKGVKRGKSSAEVHFWSVPSNHELKREGGITEEEEVIRGKKTEQ